MDAKNQFAQIRQLMDSLQFGRANEVLAELHDDCFLEPDYWWLIAVCHGEQGDHDAAIAALESATTYCPLDIQSQVLLGKLYADRGYTESAVVIFEFLAQSPKAISQYREEIIRQLGRLKCYETAARLCDRAATELPDDWQIWFAKAYYLGRVGEPNEQVVEALRRALTLKPDQLSIRVSLVKTLAALGMEEATHQAAGEISIDQISQLCCRDCVCQLARVYQSSRDRQRWQACIQRYAILKQKNKHHGT